MLENLQKYSVVLASASPRRKELLARLGIDFKVRALLGVDESYPLGLAAEEVAPYVSRKKAMAYRTSMAADELLITADTVVCLGGDILGKPADKADALRMLALLSGREHAVVTGVTVATPQRMETFATRTAVKFAELERDVMEYYVNHFLPMDKAGAYGIQELIGLVGVEEIRGCYFNVVGLPVSRLYAVLRQF